MAALEMGSVSAMPTSTDTRMPISRGCSSVAHMISWPTLLAAAPMPGAISSARPTPTKMVTPGVARMSTRVSLLISLPHSAAITVITSTAKGPPAPPSALAALPTATRLNSTSGGHCSAQPMLTAMAGPATALA